MHITANRIQEIVDVLRNRIAGQQIPPGYKLLEQDLAEEFLASRTTIREAFSALEQRGLIQRIPNRGAVVTRLDIAQVFHIYDTREVMEGLCMRLATQNAAHAFKEKQRAKDDLEARLGVTVFF